MPTIFSHAIFASAIGSAFRTFRAAGLPARFWILTAGCSMLPDLDVVALSLGIPYSSMWGHRGISHSLFFAIIIGAIVPLVFFRADNFSRWKLALYFAAVTVTHPLLDMLTNGGLGVALLAPLNNERFFLPWRPIEVSPIGAGFFSGRGLEVVLNEIIWIWLPSLLATFAAVLLRRKRMSAQRTEATRT